ncbi:MAG: winged helix-turn-helix transcriptional regulator [Parcubacteria group bacterium]|jgi:DNA-binding Lrp family transcriptional regulator
MIKLTELDKKILFELDRDGRASYSKIARNIGTTPQVVKYHVEQLVEKGVIKNFWLFANFIAAGYSFFWAYWFKFSGLSKEKAEEIFTSFRENKYMPIVFRSEGWADAMVCIATKDIFSHNEELNKVLKTWGKNIAMCEVGVGLDFQQFPRTYLVGKDNTEKVLHISGGASELQKINETERKVMSVLQQEGRMEFTELAKVLGISTSMAHTSFKKLFRRKVVSKTALTLNHAVIGTKHFRVVMKIAQHNPERINQFYDFCVVHRNILNWIPVMGNWQLFLDIEIENHEGLRELIREMKFQFEDVIIQVEVNEIYKTEKFSQMVIEYPELLVSRNMEHETRSMEHITHNT